MRRRIRFLCIGCGYVVAASLSVSGGCASKTQGLFTRPELINRGRMAVIGLTPEQEQIFMASYTKAFPGQIITFVERKQLQELLSEQDLLKGRLDDRSRARIKQILGVEALILCAYYDDEKLPDIKKLRVRIVDSSTGAIMGSVITKERDYFEFHCDLAVKALKADLLSGSR